MGWSGLSLRLRMVFLFGLNTMVGTHFTVIVGFMMGVRGLFMGENLINGVQKKAGFCFIGSVLGRRHQEKGCGKGGIAFSFDEEIGVIVQSSLNLLDHESMLF